MSGGPVVVLGAGLAGLSLARHLLLDTGRRVVLLERRSSVPPERQKVGESTVQLAGYYFSKVLDMEEHLLRRHYLKYNLRFYWPTPGRSNRGLEDYTQSYIRELSNVASYQLDRNVFEAELLRLNSRSDRFELVTGVSGLEVELSEDGGEHSVGYRAAGTDHRIGADWVVDATGRGRHLARRHGLTRPNSIDHGAFFWWVDGLVDIERLTERSRRERRLCRSRGALGHLPAFMATNHFVGEGFWFWVIPLHGKTSLGLVYDRSVVSREEVFSAEKATRWVCERFPLFERDLPRRRVLESSGLRSFSYDCVQTLDPARWAMTGESGRFSDPLYSPGSDLIAIHNTLIVDAVRGGRDGLESRCARHESLMRALYAAYEPSYAASYNALGDPEVFALKYAWELAVYFAFYVFPFINDLFTERAFVPAYLRAFARLGPINAGVQRLLSGYYRWKKSHGRLGVGDRPAHFDFTRVESLARARETFYAVGLGPDEARRVLSSQLDNLTELARFIGAWVRGAVLDDPRAVRDPALVEEIDPERLDFDPDGWRARSTRPPVSADPCPWTFDPFVLRALQGGCAPEPATMPAAASSARSA